MKRSRSKPKHGTVTCYRHGCRCKKCREATNKKARSQYAERTGKSWREWAEQKLDAGSFGDQILLSFRDETQYNDFHKTYGRGKYTIDHTLTDHQSGRFHVWVTKR